MFDRESWARGLLVVMVIGLMAGYALGAQQSMNQNQSSTQSGQQMSQMPGQTGQALTLVRTDKLIGKDLKDTQGQTVGKAEDVVLDSSLKRIAYIALNSDDKHYAVPWSALQKGAGDTYTLSISKRDLSRAQAFDNDRWPTQADTQLLSLSQRGMAPSQMGTGSSQQGTASSQQGIGSSEQGIGASQQGMAQDRQFSSLSSSVDQRRVTKLDGAKVKDSQGNDIGDIKGFVIDLGGARSGQISSRTQTSGSMGTADAMGSTGSQQTGSSTGTAGTTGTVGSQQVQSGQLVFTILSVNGGKYSLVPSNLVNIQPAQHAATANATKETVDSLAFSPDSFPNLSSRQYVRQIYQTFGQQPYGSALGYVSPGQSSQSGQMGQQEQTGGTDQTGQPGRTDAEDTPNR